MSEINRKTLQKLYAEAVFLLQELIRAPSFSREEAQTADIISLFLRQEGFKSHRKGNNIWVYSLDFQADKPTILLNSHHDTVKPVNGWTFDPFEPLVQDKKLFGLGSNDAGASLVALWASFIYLNELPNRKYNLIWAATAEEEISGSGGIADILTDLGKIDLAIVGEPTQMQMAIAEKGLMVLDCTTIGKAGHAAREEGENAIYKALTDIEWFKNFEFPKISDLLGKVKLSLTQIQAGMQHNVVPDTCQFVVDVRSNELYSNPEILEIIQNQVACEVKARSLRLNSSQIPVNHPIVQKGISLGLNYFGSPTLSDQALMPFPSLKIGVGDSARSHTANEFIYLAEIEKGIEIYIQLLEGFEF